jgi:O-antigen ligase
VALIMAERLAFTFGGIRRELRDRIDWVRRPEKGTLSEATVALLPPVERPNWGFWGVFAFTALLFFRPQDTVPMLAPFHLPELVAIGALIAMVTYRLGHNQAVITMTPETVGVIVMSLVMVLGVPFSVWPGGALNTFTDVYFKVVLVFILMVNSVRNIRALRWLTWLIIFAMGYVAFRGVLDFATGNNLIKGERLHGSISGMMGNPNDLATNMVTFAPLAIMIALTKRPALHRAVAGFIAALMMATVLFTKSRAGLLGLGAMLIVLVIEGRRVRPGLGVAAIVGMLAATPFMPTWFWVRLGSITDSSQDESGSRQARKDLMWEGWQTFLEHPLTGVGAGNFKNYNPPDRLEPWRETHNVLLQVAAELGVFGLITFLVLVWQGVAAVLWTRRTFVVSGKGARPPTGQTDLVPVTDAFRVEEREWLRMHSVAMAASLVGWFVCAQFASVGYYWTFYYLLALIVAGRELTKDRIIAAHVASRPVAKPTWKQWALA